MNNTMPHIRGACSAPINKRDLPGSKTAWSVTDVTWQPRDVAGVTQLRCDTPATSQIREVTVLSLFPGIDMLGMGFEKAGFCVVRGPDPIFGGDIRSFIPPRGVFNGVIGGPPCQDFSKKRRTSATGYGLAMLNEFKRVILSASPDWWLMENVPEVPDMKIPGYSWQRLDLRANEFGLTQNRLRHFQYGNRDGAGMILDRYVTNKATEPCCLASEGEKGERRSWPDFCELQGLPRDFTLPGMTQAGKYRAVGNGVPIPMAYALAMAIKNPEQGKPCICGCGRRVTGNSIYAKAACRKREQRRRDASTVTEPGIVTAARSQ